MWPDFSDSIETKVNGLQKKQILISTYREILSAKDDIDTFVIVDFDQVASSPLFSNRINLFRKILDLKSKGAKKIIIFSDEESEYLSDLITNSWRDFLKRELSDRKKNHLPPYSTPVEIFCNAKTEDSAAKKLDKFSTIINSKVLKISLPITRGNKIFTARQILFLHHNFREIDKVAFKDKSIKVRIGPIDYF
jgi:primosomal protein N'